MASMALLQLSDAATNPIIIFLIIDILHFDEMLWLT